jgi:hypothetical protein
MRKLSMRRRNVPDDDHQRAVAGAAHFQRPGPERVPEAGIVRVIPRAVDERRPEDFAHLVRELAEVGGVTVEIREIALVVERPACRHVGDVEAVFHARDERTVRLRLRMKPRGIQRGLAVGEHRGLPGGRLGIEGAADVHDVNLEAVEDGVLGLGELLDDVVNVCRAGQAEMFFEIAVGDGGDAGAGGRAEINRDAVRLAMFDGGKDAFAGGHKLFLPQRRGDAEVTKNKPIRVWSSSLCASASLRLISVSIQLLRAS